MAKLHWIVVFHDHDFFVEGIGEKVERNIQFDWQYFVSEAKRRRKEQKFSQEKLAVLAGVSKPTLNAFEQGRTNITLDSALKILKVLGIYR
jgi:DNA-binding XRE family transcriptional regulator